MRLAMFSSRAFAGPAGTNLIRFRKTRNLVSNDNVIKFFGIAGLCFAGVANFISFRRIGSVAKPFEVGGMHSFANRNAMAIIACSSIAQLAVIFPIA